MGLRMGFGVGFGMRFNMGFKIGFDMGFGIGFGTEFGMELKIGFDMRLCTGFGMGFGMTAPKAGATGGLGEILRHPGGRYILAQLVNTCPERAQAGSGPRGSAIVIRFS